MEIGNMISVSAPGKVILHGEHAVVYGKSAIAASLNLRSEVQLILTNKECVEVDMPSVHLKCSWNTAELKNVTDVNEVDVDKKQPIDTKLQEQLLELCGKGDNLSAKGDHHSSPQVQACLAFLYMYTGICCNNRGLPPLKVQVTSKLPVGAGLGSSASFSSCLAAALLVQQNQVKPVFSDDHCHQCYWSNEDLELINKWAYQGEKIIHGTPSGIDNSVATFGGALKFQAGNLTPLPSIPKLRILLTNTGVPRSTKHLVANVRKKYDQMPDVVGAIMTAVEAVTDRCLKCFVSMTTETDHPSDQYFSTLEDLIDVNQHLLEALGVSHPSLDRVCHVTSKYKLHTKLTGAGGGGCAVTLLKPDTSQKSVDRLMTELKLEGFECFETEIGSPGVTLHSSNNCK